jgi:hypothetical protein
VVDGLADGAFLEVRLVGVRDVVGDDPGAELRRIGEVEDVLGEVDVPTACRCGSRSQET